MYIRIMFCFCLTRRSTLCWRVCLYLRVCEWYGKLWIGKVRKKKDGRNSQINFISCWIIPLHD